MSSPAALQLAKGDTLVVNAGRNAMEQGATTKHALIAYLDAGVRIYSRSDLHAKVLVLGDTAIIGSANLSLRASTGRSIEAAIVTTTKRTVQQAIEFIEELVDELRPLTRRDVLALPDAKPRTVGGGGLGSEVVDDPAVLWAYWSRDVEFTADEEEVAAEAKRMFKGRGKWTLIVDEEDAAIEGELVMPVWREDDDVMFGPPARVLGRRDDREVHVLVLQDLDGCVALRPDKAHERARAQLPRSVRALRAGDPDVRLSGTELGDLLRLFEPPR